MMNVFSCIFFLYIQKQFTIDFLLLYYYIVYKYNKRCVWGILCLLYEGVGVVLVDMS